MIFNFIESIKELFLYTFWGLIVLMSIFVPSFALAGTGTIQSLTKSAWSNNVGYINFAPIVGGTYYGLTITDTTVTGYAWSANSGWIKFSDFNNPSVGSEAGVKNNNGVLSGYAWGANMGWINFNGVTINTSTGKFSGTAGGSGTLMGTLKFDDCPSSMNCNVVTDWRPTVLSSSGVSFLPLPILPVTLPPTPTEPSLKTEPVDISPKEIITQPQVDTIFSEPVATVVPPTPSPDIVEVQNFETQGEDLIINPGESGTYIKTLNQGVIIIDIPVSSVSEKAIVRVTPEKSNEDSNYLILPNLDLKDGTFYNITIKNNVDGELIRSFSKPLRITLPLSKKIADKGNLGVYWLNEVKGEWIRVPDAVFLDDKVIFSVDHLTRFAIFVIPEGRTAPETLSVNVEPVDVVKKKFSLTTPIIVLLIFTISCLLSIFWKKKSIS